MIQGLTEIKGAILQYEVAGSGNYNHEVAVVRKQMEDASFTPAWSEGRTVTLDEAIKCAFSEA